MAVVCNSVHLFLSCLLLTTANFASAFLVQPGHPTATTTTRSWHFFPSSRCRGVSCMDMTREDDNDNTDNRENTVLEDFDWRAAKLKLEEQNTRSFLKRRPKKLPYLEARKWIQDNLAPETKEEFIDLVANGNLRTPYIPKNPYLKILIDSKRVIGSSSDESRVLRRITSRANPGS